MPKTNKFPSVPRYCVSPIHHRTALPSVLMPYDCLSPPHSLLCKLPSEPRQVCHTPKQDLLWLPLNYTPFNSKVYQSKSWTGGKAGGWWDWGLPGPQNPLHQSGQPQQKPSWQGMSSYNAAPAVQSHPVPNCPQKCQIMGRLWSENGQKWAWER